MKLVTFSHQGRSRAGVLAPDADLEDGRTHLLDLAHESLRSLIGETEPQLSTLLRAGLARLANVLVDTTLPQQCWIPLSKVRLLAPFPNPPRIIAAAHNYRDALAERGMPAPDEPVVFDKDPRTVVAPGEAVVLPESIGGVTWEAELAAVLGTPLRNATSRDALEAVAGYFIFNDISASEMIRRDGNFDRGKNFRTFAPCGPVFVTAEEIPDPQDLPIRFLLNGEVMQDSSTAQMHFSVSELIARLSRTHDLKCGDMIATGTPAGIGATRTPPRWLRNGDIMVCEVGGLGRLENRVCQEGPNV